LATVGGIAPMLAGRGTNWLQSLSLQSVKLRLQQNMSTCYLTVAKNNRK